MDERMYWTTSLGFKYYIPHMEDFHIINTIRYLKRLHNGRWFSRIHQFDNLKLEAQRRGLQI